MDAAGPDHLICPGRAGDACVVGALERVGDSLYGARVYVKLGRRLAHAHAARQSCSDSLSQLVRDRRPAKSFTFTLGRPAWSYRDPADAETGRCRAREARTGTPQGLSGCAPCDRRSTPSRRRIGAWWRPGTVHRTPVFHAALSAADAVI